MKYIALILLLSWTIYMLVEQPDLTPSQNLPLAILSYATALYVGINIIIEIIDYKK